MSVAFEQLRFWVTVIAAAIGVGGAYGAVAVFLARTFTSISEEHALLAVYIEVLHGFLIRTAQTNL